MLASIQNDHGVDLKTAEEILLAESAATKHYTVIRDFLGKRYGGAWFDADLRKLVVGTTDADDFEWIELVGAQPVLVNHSLDDLANLADVIWSLQADGVVHGVEAVCQHVEHNGLEVTLDANSVDLVLQASSELEDLPIRFVTTTEPPQLLSTIFGAERIRNYQHPGQFTAGFQSCSVGFGVAGGFLTAAHCGWHPHEVRNAADAKVGDFLAASLPPSIFVFCDPDDPEIDCQVTIGSDNYDHAFVATTDGWSSSSTIGAGSSSLQVTGSAEAPINTQVCRFGAQTGGPHCGKLLHKNCSFTVLDNWFTHLYPGPALPIRFSGLMAAQVCGQRGDSGGPLVGMQGFGHVEAQGLLVGGTAESTCAPEHNPNWRTWYSPVNEALQAFGAELIVSPPNAAPIPPGCCNTCSHIDDREGNHLQCTVVPPGGPGQVMARVDSDSFQPYCRLGKPLGGDATHRRFFCGVSSNAPPGAYHWTGGEGVALGSHYFGVCEAGQVSRLSVKPTDGPAATTVLLNC